MTQYTLEEREFYVIEDAKNMLSFVQQVADGQQKMITYSGPQFSAFLSSAIEPLERVLEVLSERQRLSDSAGCIVGISPFHLMQMFLALGLGAKAVGPGWMEKLNAALQAATEFDPEMEPVFTVWKQSFVLDNPAESLAGLEATVVKAD